MTKNQRLTLYKKALKDFDELSWCTKAGLCAYFHAVHNVDTLNGNIKNAFPELYSQMPSEKYDLIYWFDPADLSARREALEKAITLAMGG
jgi:hypothetical protein